MQRRMRNQLAGVLLMLNTVSVAAAPPQLFGVGSYAQLLEQRSEQVFVLSLWSLDCPPCYLELALWGEQQRARGPLPLVLLSTDTPADAAEIEAVLTRHGVANAESWVFAAPAAQLRYEIDREWRGELPRSYLIENGKVLEALTGVLDEPRVNKWLQRAGVPAARHAE